MTALPDWLAPTLADFTAAVAADRRAHAYLLSGPPGVGKRVLAAAMAHTAFGAASAGAGDMPWPMHADFHRIAPAEDKTGLAVDQIRGLTAELSMTAYAGGVKVAVVESADTMSIAAANALLKTLEEPPGDTCLILIADRLLNLPATILSRCVHVKVAVPPSAAALRWLGGDDLERSSRALALAGGAPYRARSWLADGTADLWTRLESELDGLLAERGDVAALAGAWSRLDVSLVLGFLNAVAESAIHAALGSGKAVAVCPPSALSVATSVDVRGLFCYLDRVRRVLSQPKGAFSEPAVIETLLLAWQTGFRSLDDEMPLLPAPAER